MLNVIADYGYFRCLLEFSLGMIVYRLYEMQFLRQLMSKGMVLATAFVGVLLVMHFDGFDAYTIPLFGIVILSAAWSRGHSEKFLNVRFLVFLGDISYSLYMSHFLLREFIGRSWRVVRGRNIWEEEFTMLESWAMLTFQLALAVLLAWIVYRYFERPLQRKIRNASIATKISSTSTRAKRPPI
jgi:peptidoglycan/LPS O-acetylase OafA/YrhL